MSELRIIFVRKSSWQKADCIRSGCSNKSTLEAISPEGKMQSRIRCCENERCKARAAELVQLADNCAI